MIIQSFDEAIGSSRGDGTADDSARVPHVERDADVTDARLRELATFATGIAPEKRVIARHPDMVARAHAPGSRSRRGRSELTRDDSVRNVRDEMAQFLYTLGIDALFTNNPDQFPRR